MKFKKLSFILILTIFSIINFSYSQNLNITQESIVMKGQIERLNNIKMAFCNDGSQQDKIQNKLDITTRPGKNQEICIIFSNIGKEKTSIIAGFSKGILNENGQQICDQDMGPDNDFSKLIYSPKLNKSKNIEISLNPGENRIEKAKILISKDLSGVILGCISYKIKGDTSKGSGSIFDIIIRKSSPIEIVISGNIYNYQQLDNLQENILDNKNIILKILLGFIGLGLLTSIIQSLTHKKKKHK